MTTSQRHLTSVPIAAKKLNPVGKVERRSRGRGAPVILTNGVALLALDPKLEPTNVVQATRDALLALEGDVHGHYEAGLAAIAMVAECLKQNHITPSQMYDAIHDVIGMVDYKVASAQRWEG